MLALDTSGVAAYVAWLEAATLALKTEVREIYRSWAIAIHAEITELTPQWSGNLAANWALDVGTKSYAAQYFIGPAEDQPFAAGGRGGVGGTYSRGMEPAVGISKARAERVRLPELFEPLFIHNPVDYADAIEDDTSEPRVRVTNRLPRSETGKIAMVAHAHFKHTTNGQALLNELRTRKV